MSEYRQFFPDTLELETPRVLLRKMRRDDYSHLALQAKDPQLFVYFTRDLSVEKELEHWMDIAFMEMQNQSRMAFTIIDKDTKSISGCTSYGNISFYDKRVEIGWTWLGSSFKGAGVNKHAKFALLCYAFEVMMMERVEAKTDNLNERAKAALRKIGMQQEGILRSHMQMHSNRRRDSVYFSILLHEWSSVKSNCFADFL